MTDGSELILINFALETATGRVHCGMNVHKVREVIEVNALSPLPEEYFPFVGVHDLRGVPVPIIRLDAVFNRERKPVKTTDRGRIMVIELQGRMIGLVVSSTGRIRKFGGNEVLEPPAALSNVKKRFFNGMLKTEKGYIYLLDVESILESFNMSLDKVTAAPVVESSLAGKRVLVVEDSPLYQKKSRMIFSRWGCSVDVASNGREGLELLEKKNYAYDLVFTDIEMPVMGGIEMVRRLRTLPKGRTLPVVFNSSLSNPMLIENIKGGKLGGYIVKFDEELIRDAVTGALKGEERAA